MAQSPAKLTDEALLRLKVPLEYRAEARRVLLRLATKGVDLDSVTSTIDAIRERERPIPEVFDFNTRALKTEERARDLSGRLQPLLKLALGWYTARLRDLPDVEEADYLRGLLHRERKEMESALQVVTTGFIGTRYLDDIPRRGRGNPNAIRRARVVKALTGSLSITAASARPLASAIGFPPRPEGKKRR